jgi:hypothetical protein
MGGAPWVARRAALATAFELWTSQLLCAAGGLGTWWVPCCNLRLGVGLELRFSPEQGRDFMYLWNVLFASVSWSLCVISDPSSAKWERIFCDPETEERVSRSFPPSSAPSAANTNTPQAGRVWASAGWPRGGEGEDSESYPGGPRPEWRSRQMPGAAAEPEDLIGTCQLQDDLHLPRVRWILTMPQRGYFYTGPWRSVSPKTWF